jgi:antitoxin VapB
MNTAKVFKSGRSQAVRIPKEFRFRAREVLVNKVGDLVVLYPRAKGWRSLERGLENFTKDFMASRNQPGRPEEREDL